MFTKVWCGVEGGGEREVDEDEEVGHDAEHKAEQNDGIPASPHCHTPKESKENPSCYEETTELNNIGK